MKTMKISKFKTATLAAAIAALTLLQGCSSDDSNGILGNSQELNRSERDGSDHRTSSSVELYGRVATVNPGTREITMVGVSTLIRVLEGAEVVYKNGTSETPITLDEIIPGDSVEVRGDMAAGNVLQADRVRIRPEDDMPGNELEVGGHVESIDPVNRILILVGDTRTYNIHPNAEVVTKNSGSEMPLALSEINPGDSVDVRGALQTDGSVLANRVRVRLSGDDFHAELEFTKAILSIDYAAGTIIVDSVPEVIHVDDNTFIYVSEDMGSKGSSGSATSDDDGGNRADTSKMRITLTDLNAGDLIEVHSNRIDAANLYAVAIELESGAFDQQLEVEFKDILASVDPGTGVVTFQNESWVGTVVDGVELLGLFGESLTLSDFSAGEIVEARGFKTADNQFDIVHMHKDNNL